MTPDEQRIVQYMTELGRAEQAGAEPILISIGPFTAMMTIGALQLATRHPAMSDVHKHAIQKVISQLAPAFEGTTGAELIERGKDPGQDIVPTSIAGAVLGPTFEESASFWHDWWRIDIGLGDGLVSDRMVLIRNDPGAEHLANVIAEFLRKVNLPPPEDDQAVIDQLVEDGHLRHPAVQSILDNFNEFPANTHSATLARKALVAVLDEHPLYADPTFGVCCRTCRTEAEEPQRYPCATVTAIRLQLGIAT